MGKVILHSPDLTPEEIENIRLDRILAMTPKERMQRMFDLMELALAMKKGPLKEPQGKGVILRKKE
jgi:hypothetical protein